MKTLYLLSTKKLGDFYVLASDPTAADKSLQKILATNLRALHSEGEVTNIKIITGLMQPANPDSKLPKSYYDDLKLVIAE